MIHSNYGTYSFKWDPNHWDLSLDYIDHSSKSCLHVAGLQDRATSQFFTVHPGDRYNILKTASYSPESGLDGKN